LAQKRSMYFRSTFAAVALSWLVTSLIAGRDSLL
jgi:hypothetical protein